jgi:hypothetical protein
MAATASEETMSYFARHRGRDTHRRPIPARYQVDTLEGRQLLSGSAASAGFTPSTTSLVDSLPTAVTGSKIAFTATVENAITDVPITGGKVKFIELSPTNTVLGTASLDKHGHASISTAALSEIGDYQVEAQFTPKKAGISPSSSPAVSVTVIAVPLNVPTTTTIDSGASVAEVGQFVPLRATVESAAVGSAVSAGAVEPIAGKVEFLTAGPNPIVLGVANVNKAGLAALSTNKLNNPGAYQIQAEFLPSNQFYTGSASSPLPLTINPTTLNAPTVTSIQAMTSSVETGEPITLSATVQNSSSDLPDGVVQFSTVGPHPVVLGDVVPTNFGQTVSFATFALHKVGTYQIQAEFLPNNNRFAESASPPVAVAVTPLTAASFQVTPVVRHGHLGEPMSFIVTAVNGQKQPVPNYTGTIVLSSPTDSWTFLPRSLYVSLDLTPPSPQTTGLASFPATTYTFTRADHGTHLFTGGVIFGKGGAEVVEATQADNAKVKGKTRFAIG